MRKRRAGPGTDEPGSGEREAALERQSTVRHDLRAPLAVMLPALSLLRDEVAGPLTPLQRDYLEILERNVLRLETLLAAALESGWVDCAAAPQEPAAVPLGELVEEVLAARRARAGDSTDVLVVRAPGAPATAWADREQVRCVVRNLLENALAAAGDAAAVSVLVGEGDDPASVVLAVEDTGPGMSPDEAARAFEFGYRTEAAREAGVPGLGAGLWVTRVLVERNGGTIVLESRAGAGTTVTVTLPAAQG